MDTSLVRRSLEESLTLESLGDVIKSQETVMLLIDTSGSMTSSVRPGVRAIDALREVVSTIKAHDTCPMIAFGGPYDAQVRFVDIVPEPDGGTPLHMAIPFAKSYGATRLVVISDGCPDLHEQSMIEARAFGGQIDVVFIGSEGDYGSMFLDQLAQATGGRRLQGDLLDTKKLACTVIGLLEGEVPEKTPIQGEGFASVPEEDVLVADDDDDAFEDEEDEEEDDDEDAA